MASVMKPIVRAACIPQDGESNGDFMDRCTATPGMDEDKCAMAWDEYGPGDASMGKDIHLSDGPATLRRAYSFIDVKSLGDEQRTIRGVATSPTVDRIGDIVEPMGVRYQNPSPLLHQHKNDAPVGIVTFAAPTQAGVSFEAKFPIIQEAGPLRDRVETAWGEIKAGLVRAVSIGFRSLDHEVMKTGGLRYKAVEVLELSLVTVPANADCNLSVVKSIDHALLAASGRPTKPISITKAASVAVKAIPPGVTGNSTKPVTRSQEAKVAQRKPISEQIASYTGTRMAKSARMDELMDDANDRGETLNNEELDEYQGIEAEVKALDTHIRLLNEREKRGVAQATSVESLSGSSVDVGAGVVRRELSPVRVTPVKVEKPKGTDFVRYIMCVAKAKGNMMQAHHFAKQHYMDQSPDIEMVLRTAVDGGTTFSSDNTALVYYQNMASEFVDYLRPLTIMGRIAGLRRVPFNIKVPRQTTGSTVGWVGETSPKPVSSLIFDQLSLGHSKIAGIIPISDELLRFSSPAVEQIIRNDLADAIAVYMDRDFVDPTKAIVTNVSPASITNGVTPTVASGTTAAALRLDLQTTLNLFLRDNLSPVGGVWIMTQQQALAISLMLNTLGQPVFPNITMEGGSLLGFPVVASENVPTTGSSPTDGSAIIFAKAGEILVADDGGVNISVSNEASLQMDTAPDSPATASTVLVSLWQQNMTAIRCEREVNWLKRRSDAVAYISYAKYTS